MGKYENARDLVAPMGARSLHPNSFPVSFYAIFRRLHPADATSQQFVQGPFSLVGPPSNNRSRSDPSVRAGKSGRVLARLLRIIFRRFFFYYFSNSVLIEKNPEERSNLF